MDLNAIGADAFAFSSIGADKGTSQDTPDLRQDASDYKAPTEAAKKPSTPTAPPASAPKTKVASTRKPEFKAHELSNDNAVSRGRVANFLLDIAQKHPNPYIEAAAELLRKDPANWDKACVKLDAETIRRRVDCQYGIIRLMKELPYAILKAINGNMADILEQRKDEDLQERRREAREYTASKIAELRALGVDETQIEVIEEQMFRAILERDVTKAKMKAEAASEVSDDGVDVSHLSPWARGSKYKDGVEQKKIAKAMYKVTWRGTEFYWQGSARRPLPFKIHLASGGTMEELRNHDNMPPYYAFKNQANALVRDYAAAMKEELAALEAHHG